LKNPFGHQFWSNALMEQSEMSSILRTIFGYALACLTAAAVVVLFVKTPAQLLALPQAEQLQTLESTGLLILAAATHSAVFALPFALIAILIGILFKSNKALFYSAAGVAISLFGFAALYFSDPARTQALLNSYALTAYALSGLLGGYAYWLFAGRFVGKAKLRNTQEKVKKKKAEKENVTIKKVTNNKDKKNQLNKDPHAKEQTKDNAKKSNK